MLDRSKHEIKMRELVLKIYAHPELARLLMFKGGTACYFFHHLPRFSTDLDFSLLDEEKRQYVFDEMSTVASSVGVIKDAWMKMHTLFFLVEHTSGLSAIKIEISTRDIEQLNSSELLPLYGRMVQVMIKSHLFANKLYALKHRITPTVRDVYDIHFFFSQGWELDEALLSKLVTQPAKDYITSLPGFIKKNFNQKNITEGLNYLLATESERQFVKQDLLEDTVVQIKMFLDAKALG